MPKSKPFTVRLSEEVGGWLERENRRTRLPKGALLEALAEESIRTRRFPGIGFRGAEHSRRAWVIGTGLDVWEVVELYRGKGRERLLAEHDVSAHQLDLALSYHEAYPREVDEALEENAHAGGVARSLPGRRTAPAPRSRLACALAVSPGTGEALLLDAHVSGRTVGKALTSGASGHDVRALDSETELEALSDPEVLELAAVEGRVLVTANVRDFEPLLREWTGEGRSHAGVILVPESVRNESFGVLISGVENTLADTVQEG